MFGQTWSHYGLGFLLALVLALWAVIHIVQNDQTSPFWKAVWCVFVLFVPVIGFLIWLVAGPRSRRGALFS